MPEFIRGLDQKLIPESPLFTEEKFQEGISQILDKLEDK